jgi:hypothetical protein
MEELTQPPLPGEMPKRPGLLTVICILTFIGSGMQLFSSLVIAGFYDMFVEVAKDFAVRFNIPAMEQLMEVKPLFFIVSAILYAGSLTGAILMMNLKKAGFHVYTVSQILLILSPMYFLHLPTPGVLEMLFSGLFIFLYSLNLKYMA